MDNSCHLPKPSDPDRVKSDGKFGLSVGAVAEASQNIEVSVMAVTGRGRAGDGG
jgi:hypothetical protein